MTSAAPQPVRVVVADDQTAVREALAAVLDLMPGLAVVATAGDGAAAVAAVAEHEPDVVLMDLHMPGMGGVEATAAITAAYPDVAVVVLTTLADAEAILAALDAGARGYLTKQSGRQDIARAIEAAAAGQGVLDPAVQRRLVQAAAGASATASTGTAAVAAPLPAGLTAREVEVLRLVGRGLSNRAIARELFLGEATVKTHLHHVFAKTGLGNRAGAMQLARDCGLADG